MIVLGKHRKAYAAAVAAQKRVNAKRAAQRPAYAEEERAQRLIHGLPLTLKVFAERDAKKL